MGDLEILQYQFDLNGYVLWENALYFPSIFAEVQGESNHES